MTDQDVRWEQYPRVSKRTLARAWLGLQGESQSRETYGRDLRPLTSARWVLVR
jgi:hypothetical protein